MPVAMWSEWMSKMREKYVLRVQKLSIEDVFFRTSLTVILPGIFAEQVTRENLNAFRRGVCEQFSEIVNLHMNNY